MMLFKDFMILYSQILDHGGAAIGTILRHIRDKPSEGRLFHCTGMYTLIALELSLLANNQLERTGQGSLLPLSWRFVPVDGWWWPQSSKHFEFTVSRCGQRRDIQGFFSNSRRPRTRSWDGHGSPGQGTHLRSKQGRCAEHALLQVRWTYDLMYCAQKVPVGQKPWTRF